MKMSEKVWKVLCTVSKTLNITLIILDMIFYSFLCLIQCVCPIHLKPSMFWGVTSICDLVFFIKSTKSTQIWKQKVNENVLINLPGDASCQVLSFNDGSLVDFNVLLIIMLRFFPRALDKIWFQNLFTLIGWLEEDNFHILCRNIGKKVCLLIFRRWKRRRRSKYLDLDVSYL